MVDGLGPGESGTTALPLDGGCYGSTTIRRRASTPCLQKFATRSTAQGGATTSDPEGVVVQIEGSAVAAGPPTRLLPEGHVADHHRTVGGLAHVVDGQRRHRTRGHR